MEVMRPLVKPVSGSALSPPSQSSSKNLSTVFSKHLSHPLAINLHPQLSNVLAALNTLFIIPIIFLLSTFF